MRRSPARFLAPIALVAFGFALYTVVQDAREPAGGPASEVTATPTADKTATKKSKSKKRKTYKVKSGDTASGIAEKAGISLDTLLELNPDLNPQALTPGTRLKLSK